MCLAQLVGLAFIDPSFDLDGRAEGATLYVNTTGSGGAFTSIQAAINSTNSGDVICVYSGIYYENVVVNKSIKLYGINNQTTIVDGSSSGYGIQVSANNVVIDNFTIQNGHNSAIYLNSVNNCTIYRTIIKKPQRGLTGASSIGIHLYSSNNNTIKNNVIYNINGRNGNSQTGDWNTNPGENGALAVGIYLKSSNNNSIYKNDIKNISAGNGGNGSRETGSVGSGGSGGMGVGIYLSMSINNSLRNNFIRDIHGGLGGIGSPFCPKGNSGSAFGIFLKPDSQKNIIDYTNNVGGSPIIYFCDIQTENTISGYQLISDLSSTNLGKIVLINCSNFLIQNNDVSFFFGKNGGTRTDIEHGGNGSGILIESSKNIKIRNNSIKNIYGGSGSTSTWWKPSGDGGLGSGILVRNSFDCEVINNTFDNITGGTGGGGGAYSGWSGAGGLGVGIYFDSSFNQITSLNSMKDIYGGLGSSHQGIGTISGPNNTAYGFFIDEESFNINLNSSNTVNGEPVHYYTDIKKVTVIENLSMNSSINPTNFGKIALINCSNFIIRNNKIGNYYGGVGERYERIIESGSTGKNGYGIYLFNSSNNLIINNTISKICGGVGGAGTLGGGTQGSSGAGGMGIGIYLRMSNDNTFSYNRLYNISGGYGRKGGHFGSDGADNIGYGVFIEPDSLDNTINPNNTVDSEPLYYFYNIHTPTFIQNQILTGRTQPTNFGKITLINTSNFIIQNNTISNYQGGPGNTGDRWIPGENGKNGTGIYLLNSSDCILRNNTIYNIKGGNGGTGGYSQNGGTGGNGVGVYLDSSSRITVNDSKIFNVTGGTGGNGGDQGGDGGFGGIGIGIFLCRGTNNSLNGSIIDNNKGGNRGEQGHFGNMGSKGVSSSFQIILSYNNTIIANSVHSNDVYGIYLSESSNNTFYHNNIMYNLNQVFIDTTTCFNNVWDDGNGEGNYWSDYNGLDDGSGGRIVGDGIGDTEIPHPFIDQGNGYYQLDNYPFMKPVSDIYSPEIQLKSPKNNSVIKPGVNLLFNIFDWQIDNVNYSINGSMKSIFEFPYEIPTAGWNDGLYEIEIEAKDTSNNNAIETFLITIDSKPPLIFLNSPDNNSMIPNGTVLDFYISDLNLMEVKYSVNGGDVISLPNPYNIIIINWADGSHKVQIEAFDKAGNSNTSWYNFLIDMTSPEIKLNAPSNNSVKTEGIILDFSIFDPNLIQVNYSINGLPDTPFSNPYNISTLGWSDGDYIVQVNAVDLVGNMNFSWYFITIDSTKPRIFLNSPQNDSIIQNGTILDFSITDLNLMGANYSVNDGLFNTIMESYNISTTNWTDGNYTVKINMVDLAGNSNSSWFFFTIDSVPPDIWFNPIFNNSIIPVGKLIPLNITDLHLESVRYSLEGEEFIVLEEPFIINTTNWVDSNYNLSIIANDTAENEARISFKVTVDAIPPNIDDPYIFFIRNQLTEILNFNCTLTFTEPMNTTNIKDYISFSLPIEFNCTWNAEGTYLIISSHTDIPSDPLDINITIDSNLTDINGVNLSQEFNFQFTYYPDFDNDGIVDGDDPDDDDDGYNDALEISEGTDPLDSDSRPLDNDGDLIPDSTDPDDDNDGKSDDKDAFPFDPSEWQDFDGDGVGDNADTDDDDDGILDEMDDFPLDPKRWKEEESQGDILIYVLFIIIIIIVTLILVLLFLRQRKGKGESSLEEPKENEGEFLEVEVIEPGKSGY